MIFFWWIFLFAVMRRYAIFVMRRFLPEVSDTDSPCVSEDKVDLYDESNFSPRWMSLTEEEKRRRLSLELDEYLKG